MGRPRLTGAMVESELAGPAEEMCRSPGEPGGSVLVTGAAGFIGLPVVAELARRGEEVHALSTRALPLSISGVHWHQVDLLSDATLERLMRNLAPKRLVHLAWYTRHDNVWHAPENVIWVERSLHLMRAFVRNGGRRLVMLGSCAEYDWLAADGPLNETGSRLAPATLYGSSKDGLRRVARAYAEREGVEFAWGRPFFLYGPREAPGRLVPSVIRSLLAGDTIATSSGGQVRDYMHVEDVASAVVALLKSPVTGEVNIASGVGVTVTEIVEQIVQLIGRPELIRSGALPDRSWEPPRLVADVGRLREEVGHRPMWGLSEGLAQTARWWEK